MPYLYHRYHLTLTVITDITLPLGQVGQQTPGVDTGLAQGTGAQSCTQQTAFPPAESHRHPLQPLADFHSSPTARGVPSSIVSQTDGGAVVLGGSEHTASGLFMEQKHTLPSGSTTSSPSPTIWPDFVLQFGPVEHRGSDK